MNAASVIRRYVDEVLRDRRVDSLDHVAARAVEGHEPAREVHGIAEMRESLAGWFSSFPDLEITTDDLFAHGDRVTWRWSLRGTHAPTGRKVQTSGIIVFRIADDRIAEYWGHYDRLGLLKQQGLLPEDL